MIKCQNCGKIINTGPGGKCPKCGETGRRIYDTVSETMDLSDTVASIGFIRYCSQHF